jgi:NAD(P)-dependent dehydrogenase (short-subunit alcohol dehydrogenase family)
MESLEGKVAVVTGAAAGIGLALAQQWADEKMMVVVADWDASGLQAAADQLSAGGAEVLAVPTDVSDPASVTQLADAAYDRFGAVHLLCNNAGILGPSDIPIWEIEARDFERVFAVNIWGVIHGLRTFVPRMLAQDSDGHIVNTSSMGAVTTNPSLAPYIATKHAIMALTETLRLQLRQAGARIGVSVLCPGPTRSSITANERKLTGAPPLDQAVVDSLNQLWDPADSAAILADAIRRDSMYVFPNPGSRERILERYDAIMASFDGAQS